MLVLSRHKGQSIMIGDDIEITVNKVVGNRVSLGIEAPAAISIDRKSGHQLSPDQSARINRSLDRSPLADRVKK